MTLRYCPDCAARLTATSTTAGVLRRVCPECDADTGGSE